ncbi:MAG: RNA polymerase sigma factor RpoD [uncultured Rubrobacteraceae bacterium]|uniref:RNA polymerase sigma factor n=1 Tax=uncultured Rubrobacteraceae bacterium TaxID=349277 RepID=A0A6J4QDR5_9ACTN|nr:MAG: RNA polymerase sigma factor RpoD [uncultured Rubrobacteraceae bacterium]
MEQTIERPVSGRAEAGPEAVNVYMLRARRHRLLSRRDEAALCARIRQGDEEAWRELVRCNLRLVVSVARGYAGRGLELADLIQEGNLGLMRAARGFDADFGTKFSTYAMWWIKQSITRALGNKASTIRIPIHAAEQERAIHGARNHLQAVTGREPSIEELSEYIGKSLDEVTGTLNIRKAVVSYDVPVGSGEESSLSDLLADETAEGTEETFMESALQEHVRILLDSLPERERYVVERRYGLDGNECATLEEIGAGINVTRERVRQIQASALRKLRAFARDAELDSFLEPCFNPAS